MPALVHINWPCADSHTSFIRAGSKIQTNVNLIICTAGRAPLGKLKIIYKNIIMVMAPLTARHPKSLRFLNQRRKQNCSV